MARGGVIPGVRQTAFAVLITAPHPYENDQRLGVITSYFNPRNYAARRANFLRFVEPFEASGSRLVVIEGVYQDTPRLPSGLPCQVIAVQCTQALWQKERLINIGLAQLPSSYPYVAWIDCDILFGDDDWMVRAVSALDDGVAFLQLFGDVVQVPRSTAAPEPMQCNASFGRVLTTLPVHARSRFLRDCGARGWTGGDGQSAVHGHTGFAHTGYAWAARADIVRESGLYDRCLTSSSDHFMAHAMAGAPDAWCVGRALGTGSPAYRDFLRWTGAWRAAEADGVGCLSGTVFHLWHGDLVNRRYSPHNRDIQQLGFDPATDMLRALDGSWQLPLERGDLAAWSDAFFASRQEDG